MTERMDITADEQTALNQAFESTPNLFQLLSTVRTRRMGMGYRSESGTTEEFTWSSNSTTTQAEGPLSYESDCEPVPLTEVEEALVAWAGLGPNGVVAADIPAQGDLSSLVYWAGRTAPGSSADLSVDLLIINDRGVSLYRPGARRSKPV